MYLAKLLVFLRNGWCTPLQTRWGRGTCCFGEQRCLHSDCFKTVANVVGDVLLMCLRSHLGSSRFGSSASALSRQPQRGSPSARRAHPLPRRLLRRERAIDGVGAAFATVSAGATLPAPGVGDPGRLTAATEPLILVAGLLIASATRGPRRVPRQEKSASGAAFSLRRGASSTDSRPRGELERLARRGARGGSSRAAH